MTYKDSCVGCHSEIDCIGFSCKYSQTSCYLCDDRNEELEPSKLRYKDGDMLCFDCLAQRVWEEADKISVRNLI